MQCLLRWVSVRVCVEAARLAAETAGTYSVIVSCGTRRGALSMPLPPDTTAPALHRPPNTFYKPKYISNQLYEALLLLGMYLR